MVDFRGLPAPDADDGFRATHLLRLYDPHAYAQSYRKGGGGQGRAWPATRFRAARQETTWPTCAPTSPDKSDVVHVAAMVPVKDGAGRQGAAPKPHAASQKYRKALESGMRPTPQDYRHSTPAFPPFGSAPMSAAVHPSNHSIGEALPGVCRSSSRRLSSARVPRLPGAAPPPGRRRSSARTPRSPRSSPPGSRRPSLHPPPGAPNGLVESTRAAPCPIPPCSPRRPDVSNPTDTMSRWLRKQAATILDVDPVDFLKSIGTPQADWIATPPQPALSRVLSKRPSVPKQGSHASAGKSPGQCVNSPLKKPLEPSLSNIAEIISETESAPHPAKRASGLPIPHIETVPSGIPSSAVPGTSPGVVLCSPSEPDALELPEHVADVDEDEEGDTPGEQFDEGEEEGEEYEEEGEEEEDMEEESAAESADESYEESQSDEDTVSELADAHRSVSRSTISGGTPVMPPMRLGVTKKAADERSVLAVRKMKPTVMATSPELAKPHAPANGPKPAAKPDPPPRRFAANARQLKAPPTSLRREQCEQAEQAWRRARAQSFLSQPAVTALVKHPANFMNRTFAKPDA